MVIIYFTSKYDIGVMNNERKKELLLNLAKKVKSLRLMKGISQETAYNDTGIHFGRIEQGKRNISFTTLYEICNYFNISLTEFFANQFDNIDNANNL